MTKANKFRLRFAKCGDLRLVSHHDIMRCLERMVRRARIPMAHSQGFNPRPKITFALALGVGIEGCNEVVDLELSEAWEPPELLRRLRAEAPCGFEWKDARPLPPSAAPPRPRSVEYCLQVPADRRPAALGRLQAFLASSSWPFDRQRPGRQSVFDLRLHLVEAELRDDGLFRFRLTVCPDGSARPEELLEAIELRDLLDRGGVLTRTELELEG
jgi:radical SAM-linked protein